ncbi:hypothetical protein NH340_JMT01788 [Sarcoptes scabiei]|nr:hypothetical protein NH340_JMT01788 [Sarcoptes scabiei]
MASKLLSRFGSKKDLTLQQQHFDCTIKLLDDEEVVQTNFQKEQKGQFLLDYVFKMLNLLERDYFGLRFVDPNNQRVWLDPTKLIYKQVKNITPPIIFCFRVKYYPANPTTLKEELTRYYLYLQLRRDILNQKLHCLSDSTYLMACVLQSDLGDFDAQDHKGNYIASMKIKILPNQNEKIELEAIEIHQKEMKGLTPADVELLFLQRASKLDTYGIDPYPVKDQKKNQFLLGINYSGIVCFEGNKKVNHFAWTELQKIIYEGKMLILHHYSAGKKNLIGFKCSNVMTCQNLWRTAVEQRYFFTMNSSNEIPMVISSGGLFSKQCKLRYSGRVEKELIEDMKKVPASGGTINRRHSMNMGPSMMHSVGRSNTAPLPDASPPKFQSSIYEDKNPYLNYSVLSDQEPYTATNNNTTNRDQSLYPNSSLILEPKDLNETLQQSTACLPTEFNLRPDLTPNGQEQQTISFETPVIRSSPSQLSQTKISTGEETNNDSDETLEQVSEIVDQSISTAHHYYQQQQNQTKESINKRAGDYLAPSTVALKKRPTLSKLSFCKKMAMVLVTSLLSALIILSLVLIVLILILEIDNEFFEKIRGLPEMTLFRQEYYDPIREQVLQSYNHYRESFKIEEKR